MRMEKIKFRIGELAEHLNVERFVIRFWEKEFNFKAHRSNGGQRFYDENDLQKFKAIKELLYNKKFTIAGAKQLLQDTAQLKKLTKNPAEIVASHITTLEQPLAKKQASPGSKHLIEKLSALKKALIHLKKIL